MDYPRKRCRGCAGELEEARDSERDRWSGGRRKSLADRFGIEPGMVVMEMGYDDDVDKSSGTP